MTIIFSDLTPRELQLPGKFVQIINEYCSNLDSQKVKSRKLEIKRQLFHKTG